MSGARSTRGSADASARSRVGRSSAPRIPFALLVTVLIFGGLALLLALNTASAANELRRHDLASRDTVISQDVQQLRNEVAASAAAGNLLRAATALGMVPANHPAFIVEGADGTVQLRGNAAAVTAPPVTAPPATRHTPATSHRAGPSRSPSASTTPSAGRSAASSTAPHPRTSPSAGRSAATRRSPTTGRSTRTRTPTLHLGEK